MKHIFIRHPKLDNMQGICYGALDITVAENNIAFHAELLKKILPAMPVISSPLQRCFGLANALDANAKQDLRLLEMNFGAWQGKAWNDIDRVQLDRWAKNVTQFRAPNGENFMDVIDRVSEFMHDVSEPHIVVTHAGVIRAAYFLLGGLEVEDAASIDVPYATPVYLSM